MANNGDIPTVYVRESEAPLCEVHKLNARMRCSEVAHANIGLNGNNGTIQVNLCENHLKQVEQEIARKVINGKA